MRLPTRLGGVVPGWQSAKVLRDPNGAAAKLQSEARKFQWSSVRGACDAYVAEQLVGWAQHVAKLLRAMETGERETASVQRGRLANRMAFLRALNLEYLWGTENGLWERVAERAGPAFQSAQRTALGIAGEGWRESCEGALRLYALTVRANLGLLEGERRRIVEDVCRRAGYPIDGPITPRLVRGRARSEIH
ncbi:MAG: hypothetical protein ACLPZM_00910 [Thermoplasmata archaeon]